MTPTTDLIARLLGRAKQLDNAGDGLGYYSRGDALLDREAADALAAQEAELARLREALARSEHFLALRDKQIETNRKFWIRAAEAALAGELGELRNRVELAKTPMAEIVQSDAARALSGGGE